MKGRFISTKDSVSSKSGSALRKGKELECREVIADDSKLPSLQTGMSPRGVSKESAEERAQPKKELILEGPII